jgi:putative hydrolase of the HAD superfamily
MKLQAIIFDYGGVLCFHPPERQVRELAEVCGMSRDEFLSAYWSLRATYDRADIDPAGYWREIGKTVGRTYSDDQVADFRRRDVLFWVHLDQRMIGWARKVRAAGIRTGLLSNLPIDLGEHLRNEMKLVDEFDHHSFSYELDAAKPDAAIYRHAVAGLGVRPEQALFIDDRAENIEGARTAGLEALHFESPAQLKKQLAELSDAAGNLVPVGTPPIVLE